MLEDDTLDLDSKSGPALPLLGDDEEGSEGSSKPTGIQIDAAKLVQSAAGKSPEEYAKALIRFYETCKTYDMGEE